MRRHFGLQAKHWTEYRCSGDCSHIVKSSFLMFAHGRARDLSDSTLLRSVPNLRDIYRGRRLRSHSLAMVSIIAFRTGTTYAIPVMEYHYKMKNTQSADFAAWSDGTAGLLLSLRSSQMTKIVIHGIRVYYLQPVWSHLCLYGLLLLDFLKVNH